MEGFFNIAPTTPARTRGKRATCFTCGLYKKCKHPKMGATGKGKKGILIITEAPGKMEDERGEYLVGGAGKYLRHVLDEECDVDLKTDCKVIGAVNCLPQGDPTTDQINACRERVWKEIDYFKPRLILLVGRVAVESFLGHRWHKDLGKFEKWRGWVIPDRDAQAWVAPVFTPRFIKQKEKEPVYLTIFKQDIRRAIEHLNISFPVLTNEEEKVTVIMDEQKARVFLRDLVLDKPPLLAIDYETTGKKPHRKGHRIVCASVSTDTDSATVVQVTPATEPFLKRIWESRYIGKMAHNMKFEDMWTVSKIGVKPVNWKWCSMNAAHILDNRKGITGLKFQVYVNFGLVDYDSHLSHFLNSGDKDANAFNTIEEAPLEDIMVYCGVDAMLTYRLALKQRNEILGNPDYSRAYDLIHEGLITLSYMNDNGMCVDTGHCARHLAHLDRKIKRMNERMKEDPLVIQWRRLMRETFNMNSDPQLAKFLYDHLKVTPPKLTEKGNPSVDEEALEQLAIAFIKDLLAIRKLTKVRDYLKGLMRETVNGILRPFFDLHIPESFRSSSSHINAQNIPVRVEESKRIIRGAIRGHPEHCLVEIDYSGIEVRISACNHHDPNMIKYIHDPTTDMHRDEAMRIFMLSKEQISKLARYTVKSNWVFPQFYGDWFGACAKSLWADIRMFELKVEGTGMPMFEHLRDKGIKSIQNFIDHLEAVEYKLWNERFKVYNEWKIEHMARFEKTGYIDLLTGFRCYGPMGKNQLLNRPIQGPAFHCLLWSANELRRFCVQENWQTLPMGQIHDSWIASVPVKELDYALDTAARVMCEDIRTAWPWINVPLEIDVEVTPINGAWSMKEEIKFVEGDEVRTTHEFQEKFGIRFRGVVTGVKPNSREVLVLYRRLNEDAGGSINQKWLKRVGD